MNTEAGDMKQRSGDRNQEGQNRPSSLSSAGLTAASRRRCRAGDASASSDAQRVNDVL